MFVFKVVYFSLNLFGNNIIGLLLYELSLLDTLVILALLFPVWLKVLNEGYFSVFFNFLLLIYILFCRLYK